MRASASPPARATSPGPPVSRRSCRASATRSSRAASSTIRSGCIKSIGATVQTNVPRKALPDLADAASHIGRAQTYRAVITHPLVRGAYDERGSIQVPDIPDIRALAASLFPPSGTLPPDRYQTPSRSARSAAAA